MRNSLLAILLALSACASKHVRTTAPVSLRGPGWVAAEQDPDKFLLIADDNKSAEAGVKEVCNGVIYTCTVEVMPARYIERKRK